MNQETMMVAIPKTKLNDKMRTELENNLSDQMFDEYKDILAYLKSQGLEHYSEVMGIDGFVEQFNEGLLPHSSTELFTVELWD